MGTSYKPPPIMGTIYLMKSPPHNGDYLLNKTPPPITGTIYLMKPPPHNGDYNRDPNVKSLQRKGLLITRLHEDAGTLLGKGYRVWDLGLVVLGFESRAYSMRV